MKRPVVYMAHPLGADTDRGIELNLARALRWLKWLRASFPETTFIAPWIATVYSLGGDDSPELREAGLVDDCAVVERCDGIALVGGRVSSGMQRESRHHSVIFDLTSLGDEPLADGCEFMFKLADYQRPAPEPTCDTENPFGRSRQ